MSQQLRARIMSPGPKRILALDGGGVRGAITLGFLVRLEKLLAQRHPHLPDFRLRDYFDLIGGTSTGSIIAASLAIGMKAEEIQQGYLELGNKIFEVPAKPLQFGKWVRQNLFYKNNPRAIEAVLQSYYGDRSLAAEDITIALCVITKRADTGSTWPLHNNPNAKYFKYAKEMPLWRVVRASSAAPTYFPPLLLNYGNGLGAFIDGGVSMANNPSLQLLKMAAAKGFHYNWALGEERLMLVSIGTGTYEWVNNVNRIRKLGRANALFWGKTIPEIFMRDASLLTESILQAMSNSPTARTIDREIGDMSHDSLFGEGRLHYLRYNAYVEDETLQACAADTRKDPARHPKIQNAKQLMAMDSSRFIHHLSAIGKRAAEKAIQDTNFPIHFPAHFDVPAMP